MLDAYRRLLSVPGSLAFSGSALLARLPMSMVGLGIVLLVSTRTGSYGTAGSVSGCYIVAGAAGQPLLARLIDRYGQGRVSLPALAVSVVGTLLLIVGVEAGWARPWWYAGAAVAGAALPPWGSMVRSRWAHALTDRRALLPTAFAVEAVVDEVIFVVGPVLVTGLVSLVHPTAGLAAAMLLGSVGGLLLAAQRATSPPVAQRGPDTAAVRPLGWAALLPLALACVGLGVFFGGAEVATVAFAEEAGDRGDAGWVLACWAAGSMLAGIVAGMLPPGRPLRRFRLGGAALTVTMASTTMAGTPAVLAACLFGSGLAIAPTLIASMVLVEQAVPAQRLNEGIAWVTTGLIVGVAPGAALTGAVVDARDASTSFWVPVCGGAAAAALAWTIGSSPARRIGSEGAAHQTDADVSAPLGVDSGRRRDA